MMALSDMRSQATVFADRLEQVKGQVEPPPWGWYPFKMLPAFVEHLDDLLTGENRRVIEQPSQRRVADIGAADGDLSFFLESIGFEVDIYEGGDDSIRELRQLPATVLKQALGSSVEIHGVDLDREFTLVRPYELVFCLGVLYHLKNPFQCLERLAAQTRHCVISTKVARWLPVPRRLPPSRVDISSVPVAYLLDAYETSEGDPSNYWVFSDAGFQRLAGRAGWTVLEHMAMPDAAEAEPATRGGRAWYLLRSSLPEGRR